MNKRHWIRKVLGFILIGTAAILVVGFIVMSLWNALLPGILHVSTISFGQALGILILSKILFGGFRGGWGARRRHYWKYNMEEKWNRMSPEEREKFQHSWTSRCSQWRKPGQADAS